MALIPKDVQAAVAAAKGSLYGIPGITMSFDTACGTIRNWAQDHLLDDPEEDEDGPIYYDHDDPRRDAAQKLRDLVGAELYPYVR